jgi:regulator of sigma E protease
VNRSASRYLLPVLAAVAVLVWQNGTGFITTTLLFVAVLLPLVVVHELGHFTVAKLSGVKVLEFGVGIPPRAFAIRRGETEYSVNWLPLGGFVRMLGEEDPTDPRSFAAQNAAKRIAVLAAGAAMNAIAPIVLLTIALMIPQDVMAADVAIVDVVPGSPADDAGLQIGDLIVSADGEELVNSTTLQRVIQLRLGADLDLVVERAGRRLAVHIDEVRVDPPAGQGATGILLTNARVTVASVDPGSSAAGVGLQPGDLFFRINNAMILEEDDATTVVASAFVTNPAAPITIEVLRDGAYLALDAAAAAGDLIGYTASAPPLKHESSSLFAAIPAAFVQLRDILVLFRNAIGSMISGASGVELAGPVGIARITGEVASAGLAPLVTWTALLSINLAIVNILPIPALDGGRITFVLLELVRGGRKIAPEKERLVHAVGFALLIGAIFLITAKDFQRLFTGGSPFG